MVPRALYPPAPRRATQLVASAGTFPACSSARSPLRSRRGDAECECSLLSCPLHSPTPSPFHSLRVSLP